MPIVLAKSGAVQYVRSEEVLAEILGHSNFDGEDWAIGDSLIFEDGTESKIKQETGELFYAWEDPIPADLEEVKRAVGSVNATGWEELFANFSAPPQAKGCLKTASVVCTIVIVALIAALAASR